MSPDAIITLTPPLSSSSSSSSSGMSDCTYSLNLIVFSLLKEFDWLMFLGVLSRFCFCLYLLNKAIVQHGVLLVTRLVFLFRKEK